MRTTNRADGRAVWLVEAHWLMVAAIWGAVFATIAALVIGSQDCNAVRNAAQELTGENARLRHDQYALEFVALERAGLMDTITARAAIRLARAMEAR